MNWFKENPFLAALVAVAVVAGGALGFLGFQSWTAYSLASESYTAAVTKLHGLQNKVPFPSEANLKTVQSALDDYSTRISSLRAQMNKMEIPIDTSITPQLFQDGLRAAVNELREKAAANNVKLPDNFYFGFDQYQAQVPLEAASPFLNRQLIIIKGLVGRLVDLKVSSIDGLVRTPLSQESAAPAKGQQQAEKVLEKFPFEISFTAEQSKFRVAFNSLLANEQFLIVRSLSLQNSATQAPARGGAESLAPKPTPDPFAAGAPTGTEQKGLQVILGRELVQATMRLEIIDFAEPPAAKN